jgi:serine/threonine-protein kinase RsbW
VRFLHTPRALSDRPITSSRRQTSDASQRRIELKVDSHPANLASVRKSIEDFATGGGFDEKAVAEIGLCVNEAMANVIRHAYANRTDKPIHVTAASDDRRIVITMRDWGNGVDPSTLPQRPHDPNTPGGVGLICLRQWMDEVTYARQPDGGILATMVRRKR